MSYIEVVCPYCGAEIKRQEDMELYDWDCTVGYDEFTCPECLSSISVEVTAKITSFEVKGLAESQKHRDMLYLAHVDDMVDLHLERKAGIE